VVLQHVGLVRHVLGRIAICLPPYVDRDDLMEAGVVGLIDAANKFDTGRHVQFQTYATTRIRGAILDELRARDLVTRSAREDISRLQDAQEAFRQKWERPASPEELADALGMSADQVDRVRAMADATCTVSLEEVPLTETAADSDRGFGPSDPGARPPDNLEFKEQCSQLADGLSELPPQERRVIVLYYYEGLLLREISEIMHLSDSRICQIHREALRRLRRGIRRAEAGLEPVHSADS